MAMNKAEKALLTELRARASLTLPPYAKPLPMTYTEVCEAVKDRGGYIVAWFQNAHSMSVTKGWTSQIVHARDAEIPAPGDRYSSASQTHGQPYRTKLEALQALRWEATAEAMKKLGEIDARVAAETAGDAA